MLEKQLTYTFRVKGAELLGLY